MSMGHIAHPNNFSCTSFKILKYETLLNYCKTHTKSHIFQDLTTHKQYSFTDRRRTTCDQKKLLKLRLDELKNIIVCTLNVFVKRRKAKRTEHSAKAIQNFSMCTWNIFFKYIF